MTRKQFEKLRVDIEAEKFHCYEVDPIRYGIQRILFEKAKYVRLIAAAESIPMKTTRAKAERWKRQLQRAENSLQRLQTIQQENDRKRELMAQLMPSPLLSKTGTSFGRQAVAA